MQGTTWPLYLLLRNRTCDVSPGLTFDASLGPNMCPWDQAWDASLGPNMWSITGTGFWAWRLQYKYSLSVTRRSLWSKQKRMWRRSLVLPSVRPSVTWYRKLNSLSSVIEVGTEVFYKIDYALSLVKIASTTVALCRFEYISVQTTCTDAFEQLWLLQNGRSGYKMGAVAIK